MNRIEQKFRELKKKNKKAFIAFITAGFPNFEVTKRLVLELEASGVDIIELGVPFSDPLADGPVIQKSSQLSIDAGATLNKILDLVKSLRKQTQIPICLMSYYNVIFCFGKKRFLNLSRSCGVDGIIIPDLPPEEDNDFVLNCRRYNIASVFFLSPTTSIKRISLINKFSRGFIYYVSLTGITGTREKLPLGLTQNLRVIKRHTDKPVCVGFGVSRPEQIREILSIADGVIVGSAIVKKIQENLGKPDLVKIVGRFTKYLSIAKQ
ncbi:MAG: tryptophan synthase subunit alpha [Candidatus Omnitrophota bacterium]